MLIYDLLKRPHSVLFIKFDLNYLYQNLREIEEFLSSYIELLGYNKLYFIYDNFHVFNVTRNIEDSQFFEAIIRNANSQHFPFICSSYYEPEPYSRRENALTQNFGFEKLPLLPLVVATKEVIYYGNVDYTVITNNNIKPAIYMLEGKVQQTVTETDPNYLKTIYSAPFLPTEQYLWNATTQTKTVVPIKQRNDNLPLLSDATQPLRLILDKVYRYIVLFCTKPNSVVTLTFCSDEVDRFIGNEIVLTLQPGANLVDSLTTVNPSIPVPVANQSNIFRHEVSVLDWVCQASIRDKDALNYNPQGGVWDDLQTKRLLVIHNNSNRDYQLSFSACCDIDGQTSNLGRSRPICFLQNSYGAWSLPRYSNTLGAIHPSEDFILTIDDSAKTNPVKLRGQYCEVRAGEYACVWSDMMTTPMDYAYDAMDIIFSDSDSNPDTQQREQLKFALHGYCPDHSCKIFTPSTQPFAFNQLKKPSKRWTKPGWYFTGSPRGITGETQGNGWYAPPASPGYQEESATTVIQGHQENGDYIVFPWVLDTIFSDTVVNGSGINQSVFFWSLDFNELDWGYFNQAGNPRFTEYNGVSTSGIRTIDVCYQFNFEEIINSKGLFDYEVLSRVVINELRDWQGSRPSTDLEPDWFVFNRNPCKCEQPKLCWMYGEQDFYQVFRPDLTLAATTYTEIERGVLEAGRFMPPLPDFITVPNFYNGMWPVLKARWYRENYNVERWAILLLGLCYDYKKRSSSTAFLNCAHCNSKESYYFVPNFDEEAEGRWTRGELKCNVCKRYFKQNERDMNNEMWYYLTSRLHQLIIDYVIDLPYTQFKFQYAYHDTVGPGKADYRTHVISKIFLYGMTRDQERIDVPLDIYTDATIFYERRMRSNCRFMGFWIEYVIPFPTILVPTLDIFSDNILQFLNTDELGTIIYQQVRGVQDWSPFMSQTDKNDDGYTFICDTDPIMDFEYHRVHMPDLVYPLTDSTLYYGLYARIEEQRPTWLNFMADAVDGYVYFRPTHYTRNTACYPRVEFPDSSLYNLCFPIFEKTGYVGLQMENHNMFRPYASGYTDPLTNVTRTWQYCHWLTVQKNCEFAIFPQWYTYFLQTNPGSSARVLSRNGLFKPLNSVWDLRVLNKFFSDLAGSGAGPAYCTHTYKTQSWSIVVRTKGDTTNTFWFGIPGTDANNVSYNFVLWMFCSCLTPFYVKEDTVLLTDRLVNEGKILRVNTSRGRDASKYFTGNAFTRARTALLSYSRVKKGLYDVWNTNKWNATEYSWVESDSVNGSYYFHGATCVFNYWDEVLFSEKWLLDTLSGFTYGSSITTADDPTVSAYSTYFKANVFIQSATSTSPGVYPQLFLIPLTNWLSPFTTTAVNSNQPVRMFLTINRESTAPPYNSATNMAYMIRLGRQMKVANEAGKFYCQYPIYWKAISSNWGIADITMEDKSLSVSALFFAQESLVGNGAVQSATQQERLVKGHWAIDSAFEPQEFKSYEVINQTVRDALNSPNYWDKTVYINEAGTELQMAYRYVDDKPLSKKLLVYDDKPLSQALVPQPGTFSFHKHFDCDYPCEFCIFVPLYGVTQYQKTTSSLTSLITYTYELRLRQLGERIENKSFYMYVHWRDRVNSHVEVFTNTRLFNQYPQISFYNSEVNTCVFLQPNLDSVTKVYIKSDSQALQNIIDSLIIGVCDAYA